MNSPLYFRSSGRGARLSARRRASAWRGAGPGKPVRRARESRFHRVELNISSNPGELLPAAHQMTVALSLPKWTGAAENQIGLLCCESLEGSQSGIRRYARRHEQGNVIRHDGQGVKFVPSKFQVTIEPSPDHSRRDCGLLQIERASPASGENSIPRHKSPSACHSSRWEGSIPGKTPLPSEGNEHRPSDCVPVRQPEFIAPHYLIGAMNGARFAVGPEPPGCCGFSVARGPHLAGLTPGGRLKAWPHWHSAGKNNRRAGA
jgi:hypothetical protein